MQPWIRAELRKDLPLEKAYQDALEEIQDLTKELERQKKIQDDLEEELDEYR